MHIIIVFTLQSELARPHEAQCALALRVEPTTRDPAQLLPSGIVQQGRQTLEEHVKVLPHGAWL